MTRVENEDEIDDDSETVPFYERYWAENTTAHGVSRVANTTKWHRAIWIAALLGKKMLHINTILHNVISATVLINSSSFLIIII